MGIGRAELGGGGGGGGGCKQPKIPPGGVKFVICIFGRGGGGPGDLETPLATPLSSISHSPSLLFNKNNPKLAVLIAEAIQVSLPRAHFLFSPQNGGLII